MKVTAGYRMPIYEQLELNGDTGYKIYNEYEQENLRVFSPFSVRYITKILTPRIIRGWKTGGYIISAQTGAGKSTFIINELIGVAIERKKRIAIIVPREALATQYKKEISKIYCPNMLKMFTEEGIRHETKWGPADVLTYQSLNHQTKQRELKNKLDQYDFVVLDEVHAFVGDASFNALTEEIFRLLVTDMAIGVKRIYLSATLDIVLDEIIEVENELMKMQSFDVRNILTMYRFVFDYRYLSLGFFMKEETIIKFLQQIPDDEKAIIFVKSRAQGMKMKAHLGEKSVFIDAESKRENGLETYTELIDRQTFSAKYLCTTRWLDVGVNVKSLRVKHVVCFQLYKEEVMQMLGRKRITDQQQNVNLYMMLPDKNIVESTIAELDKEYFAMEEIENIYCGNRNSGLFTELPFPIYAKKCDGKMTLGSNSYTKSLNRYHKRQLEKFIQQEELEFCDSFSNEILKWFPGCERRIFLDGNISEVKQKVEDFLAPLAEKGEELDKEKVILVCKKIFDIMKIQRRKDLEGSSPVGTIHKEFKRVGILYHFKNLSAEGKKGYWRICRGVN